MKTFLFLLFWCFLTAFASADEAILSFHSRLKVEWSGDLLVTETLRVSSEQNQIRHGIYRDFPQLYRGFGGLREKRPFDVLAVTRNGVSEPYVVEKHQAGVRLRIGSKETVLPRGIHTFVIRYRTSRQLTTFPSHDELYWNVTGNEWAFSIVEASAEVILPDGITLTGIEGYLGPEGSKERPVAGRDPANALAAGRALAPGEGFTIVATWPPKSLASEAYPSVSTTVWKDNPLLLAGVGLLLVMTGWHLFAWIRVGRDPSPGLVIPQFEPPLGWSPAAVRMLRRMGFDNTCFSAAVMGLAVKKRISIGGTRKKPVLHRIEEPPREALAEEELALFQALLGKRGSLELVQQNHRTVSAGRSALHHALKAALAKSHYRTNLRYWIPGLLLGVVAVGLLLLGSPKPKEAGFMVLWLSIWTLGTGALVSAVISGFRSGSWRAALPKALFAIPFVIGWIAGVALLFHSAGLIVCGAFVAGALVNLFFLHWNKAPTARGREILDHIDGFRHYLGVAEEDRLRGFEGPQKTPELFERFLPYAHALDVEQAWSRQFSAILAAASASPTDGTATGYRPTFYTGSHTGFDGAMAAAALGGALSSALTTASTSPSSSGSGGGGSSGGGGGGGGGGGW
ncbi:MAG: DUF2207 domain-containing protein [Verrucomicrobiaceae bacterium]|nr:DUF2207 domain-containing protein [Verrucomicrobiaceae bacterium]